MPDIAISKSSSSSFVVYGGGVLANNSWVISDLNFLQNSYMSYKLALRLPRPSMSTPRAWNCKAAH